MVLDRHIQQQYIWILKMSEGRRAWKLDLNKIERTKGRTGRTKHLVEEIQTFEREERLVRVLLRNSL